MGGRANETVSVIMLKQMSSVMNMMRGHQVRMLLCLKPCEETRSFMPTNQSHLALARLWLRDCVMWQCQAGGVALMINVDKVILAEVMDLAVSHLDCGPHGLNR